MMIYPGMAAPGTYYLEYGAVPPPGATSQDEKVRLGLMESVLSTSRPMIGGWLGLFLLLVRG